MTLLVHGARGNQILKLILHYQRPLEKRSKVLTVQSAQKSEWNDIIQYGEV